VEISDSILVIRPRGCGTRHRIPGTRSRALTCGLEKRRKIGSGLSTDGCTIVSQWVTFKLYETNL